MTEPVKTYEADDPNNPNNLVVRGADGDPLPDARATKMVEVESIERVIEGLKMAADASMHLAKYDPQHGQTWKEIGQMLDRMRMEARKLSGDKAAGAEHTPDVSGVPINWRKARDRFLEGIRQTTGGMRQLAVCFRGDFMWSMMAQQLERREQAFRSLLRGQAMAPMSNLILPPGFVRH